MIGKQLYEKSKEEKYVVSKPHMNELNSEDDNLFTVCQHVCGDIMDC